MHGIFSWISPKALVARIARRLKPGGLLYVSYDCMPGWAAVVDRLTQLYLLAQLKGHPDPTEMIASLLKSATGLPTGQEAPASAEVAHDLVSKQVKRIETDVVPMLSRVGVV
jgi:hypothetical protein